jgi:hypothetical protein
MKAFSILIAAAAGLLLLSHAMAGSTRTEREPPAIVLTQDGRSDLPAWHPPVPGWSSARSDTAPALPEGHPAVPDGPACPVTGKTGEARGGPRRVVAPVEGLVRI